MRAKCTMWGGYGEPMSEYYSDAINKERMESTCMTCRIMDDVK